MTNSDRFQKYTQEWGVVVERTIETESSLMAFGRCSSRFGTQNSAEQPVVLKIIKRVGDEWQSGTVLQAFDGRGVVRVYEHAPGAVLMERLTPGTSLVEMVGKGRDEEATDILADIIQQMGQVPGVGYRVPGIRHVASDTYQLTPDTRPPTPDTRHPTPAFATVHEWARGFDRYIASGDEQIPGDLVESAQQTYLKLTETQRHPRLLHGDLQHYNVLFDTDRGWVAIDPKGVVGEVEYEIGAAMRNPIERPDLFLSFTTIARRFKQFTGRLNLDYNRAVGWTFAQAILSAIWNVEDGFQLAALDPSLRLAKAILPMLET